MYILRGPSRKPPAEKKAVSGIGRWRNAMRQRYNGRGRSRSRNDRRNGYFWQWGRLGRDKTSARGRSSTCIRARVCISLCVLRCLLSFFIAPRYSIHNRSHRVHIDLTSVRPSVFPARSPFWSIGDREGNDQFIERQTIICRPNNNI